MLGFMVLGLATFMIYTLVRNALVGIQLSSTETYTGTVELLIPLTSRSEFYLEPWLKSLENFRHLTGRLKVHILIEGHHPALGAWQGLHEKLPFIELHHFTMIPTNVPAILWMIDEVSPLIKSDVVILGDAELVASEYAFISLARLVHDKQKPYFVLPQTARLSLWGEAIALLNPTLAFASVFGFKKYRRNLSHPLLGLSQGWMAMPLQLFQDLRLTSRKEKSWKEAISHQWDREQISFRLVFGEKLLMRYYPTDFRVQVLQMKIYWEELWCKGNRAGLCLFAVILFIWSFPVICLISHPFWSFATILLLAIYRFFTKIIFQESIPAVILHPVSCIAWIGTFIWWVTTGLKSRYGTQGR